MGGRVGVSARIFIHNAGTLPVLLQLTHRLDHRTLRTICSMKAIRFHACGGPEVLLLEEMPVPEIHEHVYPLAEVAQAQRDWNREKRAANSWWK
jgi:hypothetical protein